MGAFQPKVLWGRSHRQSLVKILLPPRGDSHSERYCRVFGRVCFCLFICLLTITGKRLNCRHKTARIDRHWLKDRPVDFHRNWSKSTLLHLIYFFFWGGGGGGLVPPFLFTSRGLGYERFRETFSSENNPLPRRENPQEATPGGV